jgi:hypothetical protein
MVEKPSSEGLGCRSQITYVSNDILYGKIKRMCTYVVGIYMYLHIFLFSHSYSRANPSITSYNASVVRS